MEIEIDSKRNNPLLNRTEVYFTVKHSGEKTPNRELVRSELADKLNAKKENIIVNALNPSFGSQETTGYAKVYSSDKQTKEIESEHILKRNKIGAKEKKGDKKTGEPAAASEVSAEKTAAETKPEAPTETTQEEVKAEEPVPEPVADAEPETSEEEPATEEKPQEETKKEAEQPTDEPVVEEKSEEAASESEETTKTDEKKE